MNRHIYLIIFLLLATIHIHAQDVAPMIQTNWGQGNPYNSLCPLDCAGNRTLAGCGPVAMAQVLNYLGIKSNSAPELIRDCGISAFTRYGKDASSTSTMQGMNAMKKLFHCSPYMNIVKRNEYLGEEGKQEWNSLITNELRQGRPVIISGKSKKSGHLFILDGLKGSLVHINLGWNGHHDGYYPLDSLYQYSQKNVAIIDIGDSTYVPHVDTINVKQAGTLQSMMQNRPWRQIRHLSIVGSINDDDVRWLRTIAKYDKEQSSHLRTLDLSATDMTYLPDSAFTYCAGLTYVKLPEKLETIGRYAFKFGYGINQVDIPPTVKKIRLDAFALCSQLLDIKIPEGVSNILSCSFIGCSYLTNVKLPATIDTIGYSVFERCSRLENLYIPASATQIGVSITRNCPNVKIHIDAHNPKYEIVDGEICDRKTHKSLDKSYPIQKPMTKKPFLVVNGVYKSTYKIVKGKRVLVKRVRIN
ncbi:C10 family peptidase [Prevotella herbatica]|nr:C10 family peptidase [Prevotella herbatica]